MLMTKVNFFLIINITIKGEFTIFIKLLEINYFRINFKNYVMCNFLTIQIDWMDKMNNFMGNTRTNKTIRASKIHLNLCIYVSQKILRFISFPNLSPINYLLPMKHIMCRGKMPYITANIGRLK